MLRLFAACAVAFVCLLSPAQAQSMHGYTCADVKGKSCSVLKFHAWWHGISKSDQRRIAVKCGVSHCLR